MSNSVMCKQNLIPQDGEVLYTSDFFSASKADAFFSSLVSEVSWEHASIKMFGKDILQPRLTSWVGDEGASYRYSGVTLQPSPWPQFLTSIRQKVESAADASFNSALLNLYRNGHDSMGWHRDNERELGESPLIASLSFGASRLFRLRHYHAKALKKEIYLDHGSLLIMKGPTQKFWEHSVPKTSKSTWESTQPRVNITFRLINI